MIPNFRRSIFYSLFFILMSLIIFFFFLSTQSFFIFDPKGRFLSLTGEQISIILSSFSFEVGIVFLILPFFSNKELGLKEKDFTKNNSFLLRGNKLLPFFSEKNKVPLGINLQTGRVETLDEKRRSSHVLVLGATGSGKSTLLYDMLLHAVKNKQPALVIDPKGEMGSLERFTVLAQKIDSEFNRRFRLFSIGDPKKSATYNPLKNGTSNEKKDRILEALNWSEQFYQAMSGSYLSSIVSALDLVGIPVSLEFLEKVSIRKETQQFLKKKLIEMAQNGNESAENLYQTLDLTFSNRTKELLGLQAQISILNNPTFGYLLSSQNEENYIDLREVLEKDQIAYFQLNTLGNSDTARRLGRMIIEDAKSLANHVYSTIKEVDRKFFPIFVDEFGSFASKEFIEFLKQSRGAHFAVHLFCQGLEDLDAVSPEFRRQSISNSATTISFRVTDNETVNEIVSVAGTHDCLEQSYQVKGSLFPTRTGVGNQRVTKQMKIPHDILRNLNNLQAVVIQKSPSAVKGIQIFHPGKIFG